MHRALLIDKIFANIVYQMYPVDGFDFPIVDFIGLRQRDWDRLSTLLNLALTCRAFTDVALNERWLRLDNICDLLRLLPTFKYVPFSREHYFDGPILESHWKLFNRYARRVQSLISTGEEYTMDYDLLPFDHLIRRDKPLLPSLRQLLTGTHGTHLSVFGSPSLLDVYIVTTNNEIGSDTSHSFIATLAEKSPNLRRLHISTPGSSYSVESILKMKRLRYLKICDSEPVGSLSIVDATFFAGLSGHQYLSSVEFLGLGTSQTSSPILRAAVDFPFLERLCLVEDLPRIISLLEIGKFTALQSLNLGLCPPERHEPHVNTEEKWYKLFRIL